MVECYKSPFDSTNAFKYLNEHWFCEEYFDVLIEDKSRRGVARMVAVILGEGGFNN